MRKLAILPLAFALGACSSFSWSGQNSNLSDEDRSLGLKDVATLSREYSNSRDWQNYRRRVDGRTNALGRDLSSVFSTFDRHLFNYSDTDPYVNFETDENYFTTTVWEVGSGIGRNTLPWLPVR